MIQLFLAVICGAVALVGLAGFCHLASCAICDPLAGIFTRKNRKP